MSDKADIYAGERIDDLQRDGLLIIQRPEWFCFGMDAVLLSSFITVREGDKCMDLCTGDGVIPLLLSAKTKGSHFDGIEIQSDLADMAKRSIKMNDLEGKISIYDMDLKDVRDRFGAATYRVVSVNPPYLKANAGLTNPDSHKAIARHEIKATLDDVVSAAAYLLEPSGHFFMVHRPFRLVQIMCTMAEYGLEPKRMRLVYPFYNKAPTMVLIEGVKDAGRELVVDKPLIIYEREGVYTKEVRGLYG